MYKEIFDKKMHQIDDKLKNWNYETVIGKGLYKSTEKYAHIEIKIYKQIENTKSIIWNISEFDIPKAFDYKTYVENVIEYFKQYLSSLKKESVDLVFEINDGSYHAVDTQSKLYAFAMLNAIINSFDKEIEKFDENWVTHIKSVNRIGK